MSKQNGNAAGLRKVGSIIATISGRREGKGTGVRDFPRKKGKDKRYSRDSRTKKSAQKTIRKELGQTLRKKQNLRSARRIRGKKKCGGRGAEEGTFKGDSNLHRRNENYKKRNI